MIKCCLVTCVCFLIASGVRARSANGHPSQNLTDEKEDKSASTNFWSDASFMYKIYQQCTKEEMMICLKVKLLAGLGKVFHHSRELKVTDEIKFLNELDDNGREQFGLKTEKDIVDSLPRSFDDKDQVLNDMIINKVSSFLQSHTLQIKFPSSADLERSFNEGRGKGKKGKGGALIIIPLLLGATIVPIAYGALALLAGKALIVSKLALVLATIIGIKKLLSSNNKESQHEVVVSGSHGGGSGWGRDFDLAYMGYDPALKQKTKT